MLLQTLFFWVIFFLLLAPILMTGILILRRFLNFERFELLFPMGSILGLSFFVFLLNSSAFFIKEMNGVIVSYFLLIVLSLYIYSKGNLIKINYPSGKALYFYIMSVLFWSIFLIWKGNHALIGSDTNLYYSIAHTFIKGNFPPLTPWQPDLALSYHMGTSELLGAFYGLTSLSLLFLHLFFSVFFIFCSAQIILWIWKRHNILSSFILGNVAVAVALVSFGFFKVIVPIFPLDLQNITSLKKIFFWIRDLPTVNQSIEVYGAAVNLDSLIYFIFHAFGLALFLSLVCLVVYSKKEKVIATWAVLLLGLSSLALINESVFIVSAPVLIVGGLVKQWQNRFFKNFKLISLLILITAGVIFLQGGVITNSFFSQKGLEKSITIFPEKKDIKEDFISYHFYQSISKVLPLKRQWLPFTWFHLGVDLLIAISIICLAFMKLSKEQRLLTALLFLSGLCSLLAYQAIVPKFLIANGNRFLAFSFLFFSLAVVLPLQNLLELFKKRFFIRGLILLILTFFVLLPTILPPLLLLSKNRFGENKLIPTTYVSSEGVVWLKKNVGLHDRVMVLDKNTPHPSGQARALVEAGTLAPVFLGNFRAFTIEASPDYFDTAYFLSPQALRNFKISILLVDSSFYETLPDLRKEQLKNDKYFKKIFDNSESQANWEKIYRVKVEYLNGGGEIEGTLAQMAASLPSQGTIFIDNEENFDPSYLRRAIIFSLRDRDLYYLPQSGVYLNVEANINTHSPKGNGDYDYLVLGKKRNPGNICQCQTKLLWTGVKDEVFVWEKI